MENRRGGQDKVGEGGEGRGREGGMKVEVRLVSQLCKDINQRTDKENMFRSTELLI